MGILLKILKASSHETEVPKVYIDFEGVNPQEAETELYKECVKIMNESQTIMESLESYGQGATEAISRAYKNSGDAGIQEETWNTLQPLIEKLKNLRGFNEKITHIVPKIATELCKSKDLVKTITENPGITEKFSHLLDSCIRLDGIKNSTPGIQNDLSYYKRTINREKLSIDDDKLVINRPDTNVLTTFLAWPSPYLSTFIGSLNENFLAKSQPSTTSITDFLSTLIKICRSMLTEPNLSNQFRDHEMKVFVLRLMVGLIVLFDHLDDMGAFKNSSSIDIKQCIKVIKDFQGCDNAGLLNTLKYNTKHLNDPTTPKSIKDMLEA